MGRITDEQVTEVIPVVRPPGMAWPLLLIMVPTLVVALVVGGIVGRPHAPLVGAVIGVAGAALALWIAIRRADRA